VFRLSLTRRNDASQKIGAESKISPELSTTWMFWPGMTYVLGPPGQQSKPERLANETQIKFG
jgi:hypothetical protein